MAEILYCIRCGACLNVCPVYRNIGGHAYDSVYPGPVGIVVTPVLRGPNEWSELPQASSLCGACTEACPVRIDIPRMLLKLRSESVERDEAPNWLRMGLRGYTWAATHPKIFRLAGRLGSIAQKLTPRSQGWTTKMPGPLSGWTDTRAMPPLAKQSFSERWANKNKKNSD